MKRKRIVVAMSGGVDSSVAAALLAEKGDEVIGITLRLWTPSEWNEGERYGGCCSPQDIAEAKEVCQQLGVPHYTFNLEEKFKEMVVDNFISEYLDGKTPNPCVRCNSFIKFDTLLKYACAMEADALATGHYARILTAEPKDMPQNDPAHCESNNSQQTFASFSYHLAKAIDLTKDQSYFLYMLNQNQLSKTVFPLGNYSKDQVRAIAEQFNLVTAKKPDSQDVCFLEGRNYRTFIAERVPLEKMKPGLIQTKTGKTLGKHQGLLNYTIGQREKLGVATGERLYVIEKNVRTNTLVVGSENENISSECFLNSVNWCSGFAPRLPIKACVKIRYRHPGAEADLFALPDSQAKVHFHQPVASIAPGQSAVFYEGDAVLGGGIIASGHGVHGNCQK